MKTKSKRKKQIPEFIHIGSCCGSEQLCGCKSCTSPEGRNYGKVTYIPLEGNNIACGHCGAVHDGWKWEEEGMDQEAAYMDKYDLWPKD